MPEADPYLKLDPQLSAHHAGTPTPSPEADPYVSLDPQLSHHRGLAPIPQSHPVASKPPAKIALPDTNREESPNVGMRIAQGAEMLGGPLLGEELAEDIATVSGGHMPATAAGKFAQRATWGYGHEIDRYIIKALYGAKYADAYEKAYQTDYKDFAAKNPVTNFAADTAGSSVPFMAGGELLGAGAKALAAAPRAARYLAPAVNALSKAKTVAGTAAKAGSAAGGIAGGLGGGYEASEHGGGLVEDAGGVAGGALAGYFLLPSAIKTALTGGAMGGAQGLLDAGSSGDRWQRAKDSAFWGAVFGGGTGAGGRLVRGADALMGNHVAASLMNTREKTEAVKLAQELSANAGKLGMSPLSYIHNLFTEKPLDTPVSEQEQMDVVRLFPKITGAQVGAAKRMVADLGHDKLWERAAEGQLGRARAGHSEGSALEISGPNLIATARQAAGIKGPGRDVANKAYDQAREQLPSQVKDLAAQARSGLRQYTSHSAKQHIEHWQEQIENHTRREFAGPYSQRGPLPADVVSALDHPHVKGDIEAARLGASGHAEGSTPDPHAMQESKDIAAIQGAIRSAKKGAGEFEMTPQQAETWGKQPTQIMRDAYLSTLKQEWEASGNKAVETPEVSLGALHRIKRQMQRSGQKLVGERATDNVSTADRGAGVLGRAGVLDQYLKSHPALKAAEESYETKIDHMTAVDMAKMIKDDPRDFADEYAKLRHAARQSALIGLENYIRDGANVRGSLTVLDELSAHDNVRENLTTLLGSREEADKIADRARMMAQDYRRKQVLAGKTGSDTQQKVSEHDALVGAMHAIKDPGSASHWIFSKILRDHPPTAEEAEAMVHFMLGHPDELFRVIERLPNGAIATGLKAVIAGSAGRAVADQMAHSDEPEGWLNGTPVYRDSSNPPPSESPSPTDNPHAQFDTANQ